MSRFNSEVWQSHVLNSTLNDSVMIVHISPQGTPVWRCTELAAPSPETTHSGISLPWLHLGRETVFPSDHTEHQWAKAPRRITSHFWMSMTSLPLFIHIVLHYLYARRFLCHLQNCGSRDKQQGVAGNIIRGRDTQATADTRVGHKIAGFMPVLQKATPLPTAQYL